MLALTRKKGESIIIGENTEVVILSVQGEQVKLGIVAPKTVSVHRKEIHEQIQNANKEAAQHAATSDLTALKQLMKK